MNKIKIYIIILIFKIFLTGQTFFISSMNIQVDMHKANTIEQFKKDAALKKTLKSYYYNSSRVTALIKSGANPNIIFKHKDLGYLTPLIFVAKTNCYANLLELLFAYGADVNFQGENGTTALLQAIGIPFNQISIINTILDHPNLDINIQHSKGDTALLQAIKLDKINIAKTILKSRHQYNINPNIKNKDQDTALIMAIKHHCTLGTFSSAYYAIFSNYYLNYKKIIKLLLKNKDIDVNVQDINGNTALMAAITLGKTDIAELLLNKSYNFDNTSDINIYIQNNKKEDALTLAHKKNYKNILEMLKKFTVNYEPPSYTENLV